MPLVSSKELQKVHKLLSVGLAPDICQARSFVRSIKMHFHHFASIALSVPGILAAVLPNSDIISTRSSFVSHEKRNAPHAQWMKRDRIASTTLLPVRIGLSQGNLEKGHDFLMDV